MAHFAKIIEKKDPTGFTQDIQWIVEEVVVVDNNIETSNGILSDNNGHVDGEIYCENLFKGGTWKQTSFNTRQGIYYNSDNTIANDQTKKFRHNYAGLNMVYDFKKDKFIEPQPYASWILNPQDIWEAPIAKPTILSYEINENKIWYQLEWDETNLRWVGIKSDGSKKYWNSNTLTWN